MVAQLTPQHGIQTPQHGIQTPQHGILAQTPHRTAARIAQHARNKVRQSCEGEHSHSCEGEHSTAVSETGDPNLDGQREDLKRWHQRDEERQAGEEGHGGIVRRRLKQRFGVTEVEGGGMVREGLKAELRR